MSEPAIAHLLAEPQWLGPALAAVGGAALALLGARWRARRRRRRLLGAAPVFRARSLSSDAVLLAALAAIAAALLGPRLGAPTAPLAADGVDVVLLVDVSRSMDAADVSPSRLGAARRAMEAVLPRLAPRDRIALAAFAGRGALLAPLTPDRDALQALLAGLDTELFQPRSSRLASGVQAALAAFETRPGERARPRVLLVLSDGEVEGDVRAAADAAARAGARVLAAALGSETGATLPDGAAPLRDARGEVVRSRRRTQTLARLAGGDDAVFRAGADGALDAAALTTAIRRDAGAGPALRAGRAAPLAALAFALLLLEGLPIPRRRGARVAAACAASLLLAAAPRAPSARAERDGEVAAPAAQLRRGPPRAERLIELGAARLARGEREAAARAFLAASVTARDAATAALAYYDLGVAALEAADLGAARDAFFDALALAPDDRRARFNLEWTLAALAAESQPPRSTPGARAREAPSDAPPSRAPDAVPGLDAEARRRWLESIDDDPLRAVRRGLDGAATARRRTRPAW